MENHTLFPHREYRGRLAPSPTGYLHIGHARTFWTAHERARQAGGKLVMRMEDLDFQRSRPEYADAALEDLRWLGIRWDEGPDVGGRHGPYVQSRRGALYLDAWRLLLRLGKIYPCSCTRKDIEAAIAAPHEGGSAAADEDDEPVYPGTCRKYHRVVAQIAGSRARELEEPEGLTWRFIVPSSEIIEFEDQNLGRQRFVAGRDFGDFVIWRRDGAPSYQLACVVDDAAMQITEVVRGADLLKSTARQILLNRALGYVNPSWYHCKLVVDDHGKRLAKRHDALSLRALREMGLSPEYIVSAELPVEA
ncbi:MAG TPA: tRNA glutamyl-Q(34) synthetase GluQRS [Terracidiphilus sp.]|nr:tRNA glutamyl-Q(34) synthetase GluQRS [Terracidiphilus sp.]